MVLSLTTPSNIQKLRIPKGVEDSSLNPDNLNRRQLLMNQFSKTNSKKTRRIVLLKLTAGKHEASRGLSVTAGLLVLVYFLSRVRCNLANHCHCHLLLCSINSFISGNLPHVVSY